MTGKIKSLLNVPSIAAYLSRIGAEPRSLTAAVVRETHGAYWTDLAVIRFDPKTGEVDAPEDYAPTDSEKAVLKQEIPTYVWPQAKRLGVKYDLPKELKGESPDNIFEFRDRSGMLIMLQHRSEIKDGEKIYRPWTFFDDNEWRKAEPEGKLPLWGMEHLKDHTTVFIHEGAKAARAAHRLVNPATEKEREALKAHPWGEELSNAAHLGWIGGALSPYRTDWAELGRAGVKRVYIVADNDKPGKAAVPKIAMHLKGMTVFSIEFNDMFPVAFDMADPWPEQFFSRTPEGTFYTGPGFRACLNPATWATDQIVMKKGRPITVLREEFRSMWAWVEENDIYICKEMPEIVRQAPIFDGMVAPFSHTSATSSLIKKYYQGRQTRLAYRPDIRERIINDGETTAINLHTPTQIKAVKGDPKPWIEFLEYLFPVERERHEVMRWCATLIARPEVRMLYAVLLVSTRQGMGKSTLGERILAPLVGMHNTGFPSEREIVESGFNSWIANKRLVVVGEIYTGQSWKAYNTLKSYITDKKLDVNEKYMRTYTIENWAHVIAMSNSRKALRIEETDRRWYYPTLSEMAWGHEKFKAFHSWLSGGGLSIIKHWAENFGDYVQTGEHAPMTDAKRELIQESMSDAVKLLRSWCEANADNNIAIPERWLLKWLQGEVRNVHESSRELRSNMLADGWKQFSERMQVDGSMQHIMLSPMAFDELQRSNFDTAKARREWVRSKFRSVVEDRAVAM